MTVEDPDDLERTIEAVEESRVIIGHTLSTVGFQGNPRLLVIDELQFVLRPAAVTLYRGNDPRGNVLLEHCELLNTRKAVSGTLKEQVTFDDVQDGSKSVSVQWRRFKFPPVRATEPQTPLLKVLIGVTDADEYLIDEWSLTLFYNRQTSDSPRYFAKDPLHRALLRHFAYSIRHLRFFRPAKTQGALQERFPTSKQKSSYLRLVLNVLRHQILSHLKKTDPGMFANIEQSPFSLQYFLRVGTSRTEDGSIGDARLRYFPLEDEITKLEEGEELIDRAIAEKLQGSRESLLGAERPVDFIRHYSWEAAQSLIGYTFKAGAARYFREWTDEPIVQVDDKLDREQIQRQVATVIMQAMRGDTKHQFNIPLYTGNELFGAIIVNTRDAIPWYAQALPVWCARQVGWVIDSALDMDPRVNDMARKIGEAEARARQVRAYEHMFYSLVHHEGTYCNMLDELVADLANPQLPAPLRRWSRLIEYSSEDRRQMVSEFQDRPIGRFTDQTDLVPGVALRHIYDKDTNLKVSTLLKDLTVIEDIFASSETLKLQPRIEERLDRRQAVPYLKPEVLRRILSNLLGNSFKWAGFGNRDKETAQLVFSLELDDDQNPQALTIIAEDNCGGIDAREFPFGRIGVRTWIDYLNRVEELRLETPPREKARQVLGMGFLTIAKYAEACDGDFMVENWSDQNHAKGTRVTVRLKLHVQ